MRRPRLALSLWLGLLSVGRALILAASIVAVSLAAGLGRSGSEEIIATVAGWTALLLGGGAVAVGITRGGTLLESEAHVRHEVLTHPYRRVGAEAGAAMLLTSAPGAFARSVHGPAPAVVVSEDLVRLLDHRQLRTVIEHELAHLRGRHGLIRRVVELNAACLPTRGARVLRTMTRLLIELIADDAAARRAGAVHLANAFVLLNPGESDSGLQLRAQRLEQRRWRPARVITRSQAPSELAWTAP